MKRFLRFVLAVALVAPFLQSCGGEFEDYTDFDPYNFTCIEAYMKVVGPCEGNTSLDECQLILCSAGINSAEYLMEAGGHLHLTFYMTHSEDGKLPLGEYAVVDNEPRPFRFAKGELNSSDQYSGSFLTVRTPVMTGPAAFLINSGTLKVSASQTEGNEVLIESVFNAGGGYFTFKYDGNVTYFNKTE